MQLAEEFIAYVLDRIRAAPMDTIIPIRSFVSLQSGDDLSVPTVQAIMVLIDRRADEANGFVLELASCPAPVKTPEENAGQYTLRYAAWWREKWIPAKNYMPASFRKTSPLQNFYNNESVKKKINEKYGREIFAIDETINYLSSPNTENQTMNTPENTATATPARLSAAVISASFSEGKKQIEAIVGDLQAIKSIPDEATAKFARDKMLDLKNILGRIEEKRKEIKAPIIEEGRAVDAIAKELASGGDTENERIKQLLFAYDQEQQRQQRAREMAAEEERQRNAAAAQEKLGQLAAVQNLLIETERSIYALLTTARTTADLKSVLSLHIKREAFYSPADKYAGLEEVAEAMRKRMNDFGKAKNALVIAEVELAAGTCTQVKYDVAKNEYWACLHKTEAEMLKAGEQAQAVVAQKSEEVVLQREIQNSTVTSAVSMSTPEKMVGQRRSPWKWRVLNFDAVPAHYKKTVINEEAIAAWIETKKDALDAECKANGTTSVILKGGALEFYFEVTPVMPRG